MVHFCVLPPTLTVFCAANGYDEFSEITSLKNETETKNKETFQYNGSLKEFKEVF